jgi:hypothetical protein
MDWTDLEVEVEGEGTDAEINFWFPKKCCEVLE